jgi:hypothetical protein
MYELPLEPDSDSLDSFKTSHNKPYWEEFRHNVHAFIWRWGVPYSHLDSDNKATPYHPTYEMLTMGWGRSSLKVQFGSGARLAASDTEGQNSDLGLTDYDDLTDSNHWLQWDHRGAIFTAITGRWHWLEPSAAYPGKGNGPVYW